MGRDWHMDEAFGRLGWEPPAGAEANPMLVCLPCPSSFGASCTTELGPSKAP